MLAGYVPVRLVDAPVHGGVEVGNEPVLQEGRDAQVLPDDGVHAVGLVDALGAAGAHPRRRHDAVAVDAATG
jgi:hypothetical protein